MLGLMLGIPDVAVRRPGGSGTATPAPTPTPSPALAVSRPSVAVAAFWNWWGDSTTDGVGSPQSVAVRFRALAGASGIVAGFHGRPSGPEQGAAITWIGNGGIAGQTTPEIAGRVAALATDANWSAEMTRPQIFSGGLNNYNVGSAGFATTLGYGRDWPAVAKADLAANAARVGAIGGVTRDWFHVLAPMEDVGANGTGISIAQLANHVFHRRDLVATHGRRVIDLHRYLRDHPIGTSPTGADRRQVEVNGTVPLSLRGHNDSSAAPAYNDADPVGFAAAPTDLAHAEGTVGYLTTTVNTLYRKIGAAGAGAWKAVDNKHFSAAGNEVMARMYADAMMASQGAGPPFAGPQEFLTSVGVPVGTVIGQLAYTGTATAWALTADRAGTVPAPGLAIDPGGAITRAAGGALADGMTTVWAWGTNEYGTLRSTIDLYVDKPAAAPPCRFAVGGTGVGMLARPAHAFGTGLQQFAGAHLVKVDALATQPYLASFGAGPSGSTTLSLQLTTGGLFKIVGNNNAGTLGLNLQTSGAGVVAGAWTWVLWSVDLAAGSFQVWFGDTAKTIGGAFPGNVAVGGSFDLSDTLPVLLASRAPVNYEAGNGVLRGGFGPQLLFAGAVDWSVEATRRQLFDAAGIPVARAPFAAVGGVVPKFDTSSGLGGLLWGPGNPADPASLVVPSWRARGLVSVVA